MNKIRYPAYKPSGVVWIGNIPSNWELTKVKYLVSKVGSGVTPKGGAEVYQTEGIPLLRSQNVYFDGLRMDDVAYITEDVHRSMAGSSVKAGDVLLNITGGSIGRCYFVDESLGEANVNQHVCIVRRNEQVSTKYLYYLLASSAGQQQIDRLQTGANREGLNFEQLRNFVFPLPDVNEQSTLVEYLDEKTTLIDVTIRKKQRLIELLQEERTALINQAVTRGLNTNVPMKPSGVVWLGDVPAHWEVMPLTKGLSSIVDYRGRTPQKVESGVLLVTARNIKEGRIDYTLSQEYIAPEDYPDVMRRGELSLGDVLFTTEAPLGQVANVDRTDFALAQRVIKFRGVPGKVDNFFLRYWLMSDYVQQVLQSLATGSTAAGIKASKLNQIPLLVPSLDEQHAIVEQLSSKENAMQRTVLMEQRAITLLQEYRTALINEVVTGKRCVVPQPETLTAV